MNINSDKIKRLQKLSFNDVTFNNGGNFYQISDDVLYKEVDQYFFVDEVDRNVGFQIENHVFNSPIIYDKIYNNGKFFGYSMENIKNSLTFKQAIYLNIDFDSCVSIVKDIYKAIKYLHSKNILLGDIHMDNFLVDDKGSGYVIDLDYMIFPGDEYKFQNLYNIKLNHDSYSININNKNTDNIKTMICSISLILGIDLESSLINRSCIDLEDMYHNCVKDLEISSLDNYFMRIMNRENVEYFDEYLVNNYYDFLGKENIYFNRDNFRKK